MDEGVRETHQARLWRRTWEVWVWSRVVEAASKVLWMDAVEAGLG